MAKVTAITLAVTLGTCSFFSGTTKTALADIVESTTQAVTEMQTENETVNTEDATEKATENNDEKQNEPIIVNADEKEDADTESETEKTVTINPTKYSSGTVSIHRTSKGKAVGDTKFELFGVKDNGETPESLDQFEGMKFYSHGKKQTDENGNLTFTDLSLDEDEWYFIKDLSNDNVINVGSLPFYFNSEPTDGRTEENRGRYILYDINFNVNDKKAEITNLPKDEEETLMPLLFAVPEAKVQAGGSYDWEYKLYSDTEARGNVKIGKRVDFFHGTDSNKTQSSIFELDGVYAACAQHNKSTDAKDETVNEKAYNGDNAGKLRKLLYYGYGGYDNGKTFIKAYGDKIDQKLLAFATIISTSSYYAGQSCWDTWNVMTTLRKVVSDNEDPQKSATAATKVSFKNASGKNVSTVNAHLAKNDANYKNESYYYSDWITVSSDGSKSISLSGVAGVSAYRKRDKKTTGATALNNLSIKKGDKLKFRFDKNIVKGGEKATVKMTSAKGITEVSLVVGIAAKTRQDVMREVLKTAGDKSDSITFKMPSDTAIPNPPKYGDLSLSDSFTQYITVVKKDKITDSPLPGASIKVTNEEGKVKNVTTDSNGTGTVSFTYSCSTKSYKYFADTGDLTKAEIQSSLDNGIYINREAAEHDARAALNEMMWVGKKYYCKEVNAPANYDLMDAEQETTLSGNNAKETLTFYDEPVNIETGVAQYDGYYYQEVDIGKVNSENMNYILPDVPFQTYPTDVGNGSTLIGIIYADATGQIHKVIDENGIDLTLTDASDDYEYDRTNKDQIEFFTGFAKKGATVVNANTNAKGVIRVGYLYKINAVGNYSYVKDYGSLTGARKKKADELINEKGYFMDESKALAAAKNKVTNQLSGISNTYFAWENPVNIRNPYDNKIYWNLERYINEMGGESTIKYLSRKRTITKYLEIRPDELESTYAKTTGIVASDKEVFSDGWSAN